jgi:hypothetical protein
MDINKKAKLKALMDIMSEMDDMEMERLSPKEEMFDMEPEKKGLTMIKVEKSKPEMEIEMEPKDEMEMEDEEEVDPQSSLGRLKAKLSKKGY